MGLCVAQGCLTQTCHELGWCKDEEAKALIYALKFQKDFYITDKEQVLLTIFWAVLFLSLSWPAAQRWMSLCALSPQSSTAGAAPCRPALPSGRAHGSSAP